jgi:hypothetical protein
MGNADFSARRVKGEGVAARKGIDAGEGRGVIGEIGKETREWKRGMKRDFIAQRTRKWRRDLGVNKRGLE